CQDITTTIGGTAATGEVLVRVRLKCIAVIERQFFPLADISEGAQPERARRLGDVTVGITGVVAVARGIPEHRAINIIAVIEDKYIAIPLRDATRTFGFGNLLPTVGENPRPFCDILGSKEPEPSNTRLTHPDTHLHPLRPYHMSFDCL